MDVPLRPAIDMSPFDEYRLLLLMSSPLLSLSLIDGLIEEATTPAELLLLLLEAAATAADAWAIAAIMRLFRAFIVVGV
jgi:hypothetical protein